MPPVTRNQLKSEMGTPSKTPSSSKTTSGKTSALGRVLARRDPTTGLHMTTIVYIGFILATSIIGGLSYLFLTGKVSLHGKTNLTAVSQFAGRVEFVLRYQALNLLFLVFATLCVVARRLATGNINPLDGNEHLIVAQGKIHQNTLEQYILNLSNQLILSTFLAPELFLRVIPLLNILFIIGRFLFWAGYPKYRTAGFAINMFPILIGTTYNAYGFFKHLSLLN